MESLFSGMGMKVPGATAFAFAVLRNIWVFPVVLGGLFLAVLAVVFLPVLRAKFLWRLPAFKEASVSRIAAGLNLLLKNGVSLPDAIGLVTRLEDNTEASADLRQWSKNIAGGVTKFSSVAATNRMIPPLFVWVVANAGEDLTAGFSRAAEIYHARALYRTEVALYSVLPFAAIFLGGIILSLAYLVICMFLPLINMLNNLSGG